MDGSMMRVRSPEPAMRATTSSWLASGPEVLHVWPRTQSYSVDFLKIKDRCRKVRFQQTRYHGLRQLFFMVS